MNDDKLKRDSRGRFIKTEPRIFTKSAVEELRKADGARYASNIAWLKELAYFDKWIYFTLGMIVGLIIGGIILALLIHAGFSGPSFPTSNPINTVLVKCNYVTQVTNYSISTIDVNCNNSKR